MQKLFSLKSWLARRRAAAAGTRAERQRSDWLRDPLSHPVLKGMSPYQLADLPLERALFQGEVPAVAPAGVIIPLSRPRPRSQPQAHRAA